jgi:Ca2+-binding RTX toxin-like protein
MALMIGTPTSDSLIGSNVSDAILGESNDDLLIGQDGSDLLDGGDGNDYLFGDDSSASNSNSDDVLLGGNGSDQLYGGMGHDLLSGGADGDWIFAGTGNDMACGDTGDDLIFGEEGNDRLFGNAGSDYVAGGDGNDSLMGTDVLARGAGEIDVLDGGAGADVFWLGDTTGSYYLTNQSSDFAIIKDFDSGEDKIYLYGSAQNWVLNFDGQHTTLSYKASSNSAAELVAILEYVDLRAIYNPLDHTSFVYSQSSTLPDMLMVGSQGNDELNGTNSVYDLIFGLGNHDTLRGANGNDLAYGGDGNDVISGDHVPGQTTISNDVLFGGSGNDGLYGRIGIDELWGEAGNDTLFGGASHDILYGGSGDDLLFGEDEDDFLTGHSGNDLVNGGTGNDILLGTDATARGAYELDVMEGGAGLDRFILADQNGAYYIGGLYSDHAYVKDFTISQDVLQLSGSASHWSVSYDGKDSALTYRGASGTLNDLVAVFEKSNLSSISLTSGSFVYV